MLQMCPLETVAIVQSEDLSGKLFPGTDFQRRGPEVGLGEARCGRMPTGPEFREARFGTVSGKRDQASEEYQRALKIAGSIAYASPNILEAQYSLADAYSGIAQLSQMQASDLSQPVQQQIRYWSEARSYFQHSLDAWKGIPNPGARTPVGFACGNPKFVERVIAESDAALPS